jgi:hypothetical protein
MGEIALAVLRAVGYPFLRHHPILDIAGWVGAALLICGVLSAVVRRMARARSAPPGSPGPGRHAKVRSRV